MLIQKYVHDAPLRKSNLFKNYTRVLQGGTPGWILEQKKDMGRKTGVIQIKSVFNSKVPMFLS